MMAVRVKQLGEAIANAPTDRQTAALDKARALSRRQQALLAAAGMEAVEARWYVLLLRSGFDNAVDNALTNVGVAHWMATKTMAAKRRGRRKWQSFTPVVAAALPGYMFVHVVSCAEVWHALRGIEGVFDVIGGSDAPKPLAEREIVKLQAFIEQDPNAISLLHNALKSGDRVSVDHGPFASFEGIVRVLGKSARLTVDVEIFGRMTPIDLDLAQVTKLE